MTTRKLLQESNKILEALRRLQDRCDNIICKFVAEQKEVIRALYDLSDYDLEDAIYNAQTEEGDK